MSITQPPDAGNGEQANPFGNPTDKAFLNKIEAETDFFNLTPELQLIAWTAAKERVSAWGLLAAVQVNVASHVPPNVVLPKASGATGVSIYEGTSVNTFVALTAPAGKGKSATFREANGLMMPKTRPVPDGTGQGIIKQFAETTKITRDEDNKLLDEPYYVTRYNKHSVVVQATEIRTLDAELKREGSKTDTLLRQIWMGEITGSLTGDVTRNVTLIPNTYRFGGIWGVQPVNATTLLAGADDGTPQRWVWAPGLEYRRGSHAPHRVAPPAGTQIKIPLWNIGGNLYKYEMPSVIDENTPLPAPIWLSRSPLMQAEIRALQDEEDEALGEYEPYAPQTAEGVERDRTLTMRAHLILTKIKQAALIAFMHGRTDPTDFDWQLATTQMEVSQRELAGAWMRSEEGRNSALANIGKERGKQRYAADVELDRLRSADDYALAEEAWQLLKKSPLNTTTLKKGMSSGKRSRLLIALDILEEQGRYVRGSNGLHWAVLNGQPMPPDMANQYQ